MITGKEKKGSKHQLQEYVNSYTFVLNSIITRETGLNNIKWISPLVRDDYVELYDDKFRSFVDKHFSPIEWESFWPMKGGPRWDGVAVSNDSTLILVEAKSYPKEAMGNGSGAKSIESIDLIKKSLDKYAGNADLINSPFYQFANRVTFTNFLNEQGIKTTLLLLNFCNDTSHTNLNCIVDEHDFKNQLKMMTSKINGLYQHHVVSVYIKAL